MHAQIQIFLSERGGGGPSPTPRKGLDFFMFVFGFFIPNFFGDAGGPTICGGGGANANFYRIR